MSMIYNSTMQKSVDNFQHLMEEPYGDTWCYKLRNARYANCYVKIYTDIYGVRGVKLVSYNTPVVLINFRCNNDTPTVLVTGLYSSTTRHHISNFCHEFTPSMTYYDYKSIAGDTEPVIMGRNANFSIGELARTIQFYLNNEKEI